MQYVIVLENILLNWNVVRWLYVLHSLYFSYDFFWINLLEKNMKVAHQLEAQKYSLWNSVYLFAIYIILNYVIALIFV